MYLALGSVVGFIISMVQIRKTKDVRKIKNDFAYHLEFIFLMTVLYATIYPMFFINKTQWFIVAPVYAISISIVRYALNKKHITQYSKNIA